MIPDIIVSICYGRACMLDVVRHMLRYVVGSRHVNSYCTISQHNRAIIPDKLLLCEGTRQQTTHAHALTHTHARTQHVRTHKQHNDSILQKLIQSSIIIRSAEIYIYIDSLFIKCCNALKCETVNALPVMNMMFS